jgi:ribosomal protein S12 methylthiotransferase accessory factor
MEKTIEVSFPGGKKVDGKIENMVIKTDQPVKDGGEGSAPEPFQLFLMSIATCAGIYALDFCQAREIETNDMMLTMNCELDVSGKVYQKLSIDLRVPAEFPEKYKKAIVRTMDLCTVKKHIINPPEFEIKVS